MGMRAAPGVSTAGAQSPAPTRLRETYPTRVGPFLSGGVTIFVTRGQVRYGRPAGQTWRHGEFQQLGTEAGGAWAWHMDC